MNLNHAEAQRVSFGSYIQQRRILSDRSTHYSLKYHPKTQKNSAPLREVTTNSAEYKHLAHTTQQTPALSPQNSANPHAESHDY